MKGRFYDILVLKVEDTLYRIPKYQLETWSQMFKDMLELPQGPDQEGTSDEHPIVLSGCSSAEFESLLQVLLTPAFAPLDLSKEEWIHALKLGTMWDMPLIRKMSIDKIASLNLTPVEKVLLADQYKVASWCIEGFTSLIEDSNGELTLESLATDLGWEQAARVAWASKLVNAAPKTPELLGTVVAGSTIWICTSCSARVNLRSVYKFNMWVYEMFCSICFASNPAMTLDLPTSGLLNVALQPCDTSDIVKQTFAEKLKDMY